MVEEDDPSLLGGGEVDVGTIGSDEEGGLPEGAMSELAPDSEAGGVGAAAGAGAAGKLGGGGGAAELDAAAVDAVAGGPPSPPPHPS